MNTLHFQSIQKSMEILLPLGIFVIIVSAGYLLRRYVLARLSLWARKTDSRTGDAILSAVRAPFLVLCIMLGIYVALELSHKSLRVIFPEACFVCRAATNLEIPRSLLRGGSFLEFFQSLRR
jgi:hypothetical protein